MSGIEVRTLEPGELITEPGAYQCSLEVHHSHPVPEDCIAVTSSTLRDMILRTPGYVWAFHPKNEHRFIKKDSDAKRLGRAMAYLVEGTASGGTWEAGLDMLLEHFRVLPEDAPPPPTKAQIAAYEKQVKEKGLAGAQWSESALPRVQFWEEWNTDPRPVMKPGEFENIAMMGRILAFDPAARAAMLGGLPEITMAWQDPKTGVWCLSRPDVVNLDGTVVDYKRMSTQGRPFNRHIVDRRITEYAYDMQLAFGAEGMEALGIGWPTMAGIVAQQDDAPYHVILDEIGEEDLRLGQFRNRMALDQFAHCWERGDWPGPGRDPATYQRPDWQIKELEEQRDTLTAPEPPDSPVDDDDPADLDEIYRENPGLRMMG